MFHISPRVVSQSVFCREREGDRTKKRGNFGSKFKKKRKITHHDGVQRHSRPIVVSTTGRLERNGLRDIFPFDRDAAVVVSVDQRKKVSKNIIYMRLDTDTKIKARGRRV